jgi:hypothetical protein
MLLIMLLPMKMQKQVLLKQLLKLLPPLRLLQLELHKLPLNRLLKWQLLSRKLRPMQVRK